MTGFRLPLLLFTVASFSSALNAQRPFDLQGHRGCPGLMPENSIPGFLKAVELGVTTIELDVVISADSQIVVSHEPWMSSVICSHPDGKPVKRSEKNTLNIYRMNYSEIQEFDCGMRFDPEFPSQHKIPVIKPTLKMVVRALTDFTTRNKFQRPSFNIELKSRPAGYNKFIPAPGKFVRLVVEEIRELDIESSVSIQSFDINVLEELNNVGDRKFQIALLVEKGSSLAKNLKKLSFTPDIYSPKCSMVTPGMIREAHEMNMSVIPWTVNTVEEMKTVIAMGVDGIITDYPDLAKNHIP
jgi:glycerophosphoryl diester phosphodiesterase